MVALVLVRFGGLEELLCSIAAFRSSVAMKARGSRRVKGELRLKQTRFSGEEGEFSHELRILCRGFISWIVKGQKNMC